MKIVRRVVAIIDVVSFCIWMLVVIGLGNTEEFALGPVWFNVIKWGLPLFCLLITYLVLPRK